MEQNNSPLPLLSIVIASRNRIPYAISAIQSILKIPDPRLELVVQDNSDSRDLETYIHANFQDSRLRYRYTPPPFSSIDNFNAAVELATGEYLCLIGDDDGVNPEIVAATHWAKANHIDALRTDLIANYFWPDVRCHSSLEGLAGKLLINRFSGRITFPDVRVEMRKCVHNAGQGHLYIGLPKVYHGIVRRQCLDKVCELTGAYFKGLSPDIFGALASSNFVKRVASIDYPLTIGGTSAFSTAGASSAGKHRGRLEDAPHLRDRGNYEWPEVIPRFYSVQTIWAESTVVALKETKRTDLLREFNLPLLCALCIVAHPSFASTILRGMYHAFRITERNYLIGTLQFCYSILTSQSRRVANYILRRLRSVFSDSVHRIDGLSDMEETTNALSRYLEATGRRFEDYV